MSTQARNPRAPFTRKHDPFLQRDLHINEQSGINIRDLKIAVYGKRLTSIKKFLFDKMIIMNCKMFELYKDTLYMTTETLALMGNSFGVRVEVRRLQ